MRLYDRWVKSGLYVDFGWWGEKKANAMSLPLMDALSRAVCVNADDVVRQWFSYGAITNYHGARTLQPPYESLWVEARVAGIPFATKRVGMLVVTMDPGDFPMPPQKAIKWASAVEDARSAMVIYVFLDTGPSHMPSTLMGPFAIQFALIDEAGHIARDQDGEATSFLNPPLHIHDDHVPSYTGFIQETTTMLLHAVHLMNCKNISLQDEYIGRQAARKRKRDGLAEVKFKTLVIDPSMTPSSHRGRGVRLDEMPAHLVRGHFATYSEDKPLFGKYSGTFWKPAHVRGNADNGTVYKDYKVNASKE